MRILAFVRLKPQMYERLREVAVCCASVVLLASPARAEKQWETLANCRLLSNKSNDGDSFHVDYKGRECIFRLYFVDAAETDDRLQERLADQASYWGMSPADAHKIGKEAARFTAQQLGGPFTVITRWADARGDSKLERYYSFVLIKDKDLGELLVSQGLGRVYGESAQKPGGASTQVEFAKLDKLEEEARKNRRGAWGLATTVGTGRKDGSKDTAIQEQGYRLFIPSGERHNGHCPFFNAPNTRPCGPNEGKPCKICGG